MKNPLRRVRIILVAILLLPAIFFSAYEISSLNSYEEVIQQIYERQLDAILNSVNQFSVDVTESWAAKLSDLPGLSSLNDNRLNDNRLNEETQRLISSMPPVKTVVFADSSAQVFFTSSPEGGAVTDKGPLQRALADNSAILERLFNYKKAGYRKLEFIEAGLPENLQLLVFITGDTNPIICGLVIDPLIFIRRTLSPRIQEISQQKIIISIFQKSTGKAVFQSERTEGAVTGPSRPLWLLKDYKMGVKLKGATIEQLVEARTRFNIILIVLINVVLIIGFWFVFRSIRKELELAQIKADFVSNVSHELRTPLALINMYAETLEMGRVRTEEKKQEYYRTISHETSRLSRIVNKILNFSKLEAGKINYSFELTDLNGVVEQIISTYSFHFTSKGFSYRTSFDEEIPLVKADREAVSEAVLNLIDNAIKYSSDVKDVSVNTGIDGSFAYIEVADKGIGIDRKDTERIFDKFFRVSTGLVHNTKGTGLGLTLVKHIMDAHKGRVELKSQPGKGSSFRLYFPIEQTTD